MGINELLALIGALGGLEAIKWVVNFYVNRKTNARKEDAAAAVSYTHLTLPTNSLV